MVAVDIGGSHISSVEVIDVLDGLVVGDLRSKHVRIVDLSKHEILDAWANNIKLTIESAKAFEGNIAIAFPGPFDYQRGIIEPHPFHKFAQLEGINIKKGLAERLYANNQIHFQNDATCFGVGEFFYGQKENSKRILALTIGTGIGSSFIDRGKAITESNNILHGGEVYHIPFKDMTADDYFSTRWFVKEAANHNQELTGVKELIENCNQNVVDLIFNKFVNNFKSFFTPIVKNFDADAIVIGGNISKAWNYFGPQVSTYFSSMGIRVLRSELGEKAICLGAARSLYNNQEL